MIDLRRLNVALAKSEKDEPLKQDSGKEEASKPSSRRQSARASTSELQELVKYLDQKNLGIRNIIGNSAQKGVSIPANTFLLGLKNIKFKSSDEAKLVMALGKGDGKDVSVDKLREAIQKYAPKKKLTQQIAIKRLEQCSVKVRACLDAVIGYVGKMGISIQELHSTLDENKDNVVSKQEFVGKLT